MTTQLEPGTRGRIDMLQKALYAVSMEAKKLEAALRREHGMTIGDSLMFMLDRIETDANDLGRILQNGAHTA